MPNSFSELVAVEVRIRRTALGLTQQDLADMAGVSERFVRFVEQGKRSVQLDSLLALLETLGLELQLATRKRSAARAIDGPRAVGGAYGTERPALDNPLPDNRP